MKTHYILIHETGGSIYEATCPQHIFGPYSKEEADAKEKEINDKIDEFMDEYYVVNRFDISDPDIKTSIDDILTEIEDSNDY